jgi:hypothetical protein
MLVKEYVEETVEADFDKCCESIKPCSQDIAKIAIGIEELCKQKPM